MTAKTSHPRFAVLIDGDSPSPDIADALFAHVARLGQASIRRIYGDFGQPQLLAWAGAMQRHAIVPHQQSRNTPHKNATDLALAIDAMDVLHEGLVEGFCLVSSDGDFTRLALRIREQGLPVYGFGARHAPESFRRACDAFVELAVPALGAPKPDAPTEEDSHHTILHSLHNAIAELNPEDGWVTLAALGQKLKQLHPNYRNGVQGPRKLRKILRDTQLFEFEERTGQGLWTRTVQQARR